MCKLQVLDHFSHYATHTGGKKGADGANGGRHAINYISLAFNPLVVWTAENEVIPSVTDVLYILRTMVTQKFPVLFALLTNVTAIVSAMFAKTIHMEFSSRIAKTIWILTMEK